MGSRLTGNRVSNIVQFDIVFLSNCCFVLTSHVLLCIRSGNLDQTWAGRSVTHTSGDEEDLDPWWALQLDEETEVEHVRILNRSDPCCGHRLTNAIIEVFNSDGEVVYTRNLGTADDVEDVYLGSVFLVKKVQIKLLGYKILSLAEVQLFAPIETAGTLSGRQPDHARVVTFLSNGDDPQISCETSLSPTQSRSPSISPTISFQPTIYQAVPKGVVLKRDSSDCIFQSNPTNHPDRYKCLIQQTLASSDPGGHDNDYVILSGAEGSCTVTVQPVTWAWRGIAFIFQSDSNLDEINACFAPNALLSEIHAPFAPTMSPLTALSDGPSMQPTLQLSDAPTMHPSPASSDGPSVQPTLQLSDAPTMNPSPASSHTLSTQPSMTKLSIPSGVTLLRDSSPCVFQVNPSNHPDRFKCLVEPTEISSDPGGHGNSLTRVWGADNCNLDIRPTTWAWAGNMFIFESLDSLEVINACFGPNTIITNTPIPNDVVLKRDSSDCHSQINPSNHPDRFKCFIEQTTVSSLPGGHDNNEVPLVGFEGCVIIVRPVTWSWEGNGFIFESDASLAAIKDCFVRGQHITVAGAAQQSNVFE